MNIKTKNMHNSFRQKLWKKAIIIVLVSKVKVKIFDFEDEQDLQNAMNNFLSELTTDVIDIKYAVSSFLMGEEQIYCFSAMIIYC